MEDKSFTYVFYDILDNVLQFSENPSQFAEYLSRQLREIIGARTVVIAIKNEDNSPGIYSVFPSRRYEWAQQPALSDLAAHSFAFDRVRFLHSDDDDTVIAELLKALDIQKLISVPLVAAGRVVGSLLLLEIMDLFGIDAVIELLTRLSGVFGLIIKNSLLYYNMEKLVSIRTEELLQRNEELLRREEQLKYANEEYQVLNEELSDTLANVHVVNRQLDEARSKAEESDRLKLVFLQNISHEIRTPMNAIVGFSRMLDKPGLNPDKQKSFVSIIINSSNQLLSIVTDILTISSLETKQEHVQVTEVCVNTIIVELLAIFKKQATNMNVSLFARQGLADRQSVIYSDGTKLTQVLTNLLANAIKFTSQGFVEFGYRLDAGMLEFYVKDSGIGIRPEMHQVIFERFRQAEQSTSKLYGGTGLGLAISKAFVELMGGSIWVESEIDKGSIFYFTIPYNVVYQDYDDMTSTQIGSKKTVLVAEDEEYNYLYIEEILLAMGVEILHAKNGVEAIDLLNAHDDVSLVLMDIKMPVMNGYEAASIIKQHKPSLPIVAQSAYALDHERKKYGDVFDDYVIKPINHQLLKLVLSKYIIID